MNLQRELLKRSSIINFILKNFPSGLFEKLGENKAINTFKSAIKLKGYREFLSNNDFDINCVNNIDEFKKIPITDKNNYILKYPFKTVNSEDNPFLFYRSSGYSGDPVYWTQSPDEYKTFETYVEYNLKNVFNIHKKKTLIISMFALSSWVTGQQVLGALYQVAAKHDSLTFFACGMLADEPYDLIKRFHKQYEQIVVFSYPLHFKRMIDLGLDDYFDWTRCNLFAIIGAEGVTYQWSNYYNKILNGKDDNTYRIYSAFGAADTGIGLASEQLSSIILKDYIFKNDKFRKELTGNEEMPLHIFQYNPLENYLEEVNEELIITKDRNIPLVRYNLHDKVSIRSFNEVHEIIGDWDIDYYEKIKQEKCPTLNLPYVFIYGRSDDTIILNGANIYINSFKEALQDREIARLHTGKFRVEKIEEEDMFQNYKVKIELNEGVEGTEKLKEVFRKQIISFLLENDKGYTAAYHKPFKDKEICKIEFVEFEEDTLKHKYK